MLVLTDTVLRDAGLSLEETKALVSTANTGELLVFIRQELDGEPDEDNVLFSAAFRSGEIREGGGEVVRHRPSSGAASGPDKPASPPSGPPFTDAAPVVSAPLPDFGKALSEYRRRMEHPPSNPPLSAEYLARAAAAAAPAAIEHLPDAPIGVHTARMAEDVLAPHRRPGESLEECARRLAAAAAANVPPVVLLSPRRGTVYPGLRLGDLDRFEDG